MIDHDNLEEFQDPANYDLEEVPGSAARIGFYGDLAAEVGGPVLEIACGTGIVGLEIAARGRDFAGVDLARPMLDHAAHKARQRGLSVQLVEADARSFELGRQFRLIFITGNAFQAFLRREDQEQLLAAVRRHLAPEGRFAFDTRNPTGHSLADSTEEEPWFAYRSVAGHAVAVSGTQRYEAIPQVLHWTSYRRWQAADGPHTRVTRIACRFTYPQELEALLHYNGFAIAAQYGGWDRRPVAADSSSLISVCRAR